jgi:hypothetical protein
MDNVVVIGIVVVVVVLAGLAMWRQIRKAGKCGGSCGCSCSSPKKDDTCQDS